MDTPDKEVRPRIPFHRRGGKSTAILIQFLVDLEIEFPEHKETFREMLNEIREATMEYTISFSLSDEDMKEVREALEHGRLKFGKLSHIICEDNKLIGHLYEHDFEEEE